MQRSLRQCYVHMSCLVGHVFLPWLSRLLYRCHIDTYIGGVVRIQEYPAGLVELFKRIYAVGLHANWRLPCFSGSLVGPCVATVIRVQNAPLCIQQQLAGDCLQRPLPCGLPCAFVGLFMLHVLFFTCMRLGRETQPFCLYHTAVGLIRALKLLHFFFYISIPFLPSILFKTLIFILLGQIHRQPTVHICAMYKPCSSVDCNLLLLSLIWPCKRSSMKLDSP